MCSLCAALGASRGWTDAAGHADFERGGRKVTARDERSRRVTLLNGVLGAYRLSVSDWGGNSYVLTNAQGRTENIFSLSALWPEADRLAGAPCDPLDPQVIAHLNSLGGGPN
jgi:hypothetical protein